MRLLLGTNMIFQLYSAAPRPQGICSRPSDWRRVSVLTRAEGLGSGPGFAPSGLTQSMPQFFIETNGVFTVPDLKRAGYRITCLPGCLNCSMSLPITF